MAYALKHNEKYFAFSGLTSLDKATKFNYFKDAVRTKHYGGGKVVQIYHLNGLWTELDPLAAEHKRKLRENRLTNHFGTNLHNVP